MLIIQFCHTTIIKSKERVRHKGLYKLQYWQYLRNLELSALGDMRTLVMMKIISARHKDNNKWWNRFFIDLHCTL